MRSLSNCMFMLAKCFNRALLCNFAAKIGKTNVSPNCTSQIIHYANRMREQLVVSYRRRENNTAKENSRSFR